MPRDNRFESRDARAKLKPKKEPYWRQIVPGTFLGLAKGSKGASWIVRQRQGVGYVSKRLGVPDDFATADGEVVLSYSQAVRMATDSQLQQRQPAPRHYRDGETLNALVDRYIAHRSVTPGGRTGRVMSKRSADATTKLWRRNAGDIGERLVTALDAKTLRAWHRAIAASPPTARGHVMPFDPSDPEQLRARQESANRVLTIPKAALQLARDAESLPDSLPDFWRRVQPFRTAEGATPRMLEPDEVTRLLNASQPDLRDLLMAALMTGARYGELCELKVRDFSAQTGTVRLAQGKTGKTLTQPLPRLEPATRCH